MNDRRAGRPPRIGREQIVKAARSIPPDQLTMQGVADALGVDRKALHYHVTNREGLLELVAVDVFVSEMAQAVMSRHSDWRDLVRSYASAMRDAALETGTLVQYVHIPAIGGSEAFTIAERLLHDLVDAGFNGRDAARTLTLIAQIASTAAKDALLTGWDNTHPQNAEIVAALTESPTGEFPLLRQLATERARSTGDWRSQFEFDLQVVIAGLEHLRTSTGSPNPSA